SAVTTRFIFVLPFFGRLSVARDGRQRCFESKHSGPALFVKSVWTRYIRRMTPTLLLLERLATLINQSLRDDAARHGLLPIHLQALAYLAACNRYSDIPSALAEYFGTTRGTVSQTIAVLERKGLVRREADPCHGRRVHLKLTRRGRAVKSSWSRRLEQALADT